MRVALGDIDGDHEVEYVVAPGPGSTEPIRVYNFSGRLIVDSWYPFGQGYKGGYSVAIGKVEPNLPARIIIGGGVHFTVFYREYLENKLVDFICLGEGEITFSELNSPSISVF